MLWASFVTAPDVQYQGTELDVFARALTWKRYWGSFVTHWIAGDVLEVGAGIGSNTTLLHNSKIKSWTCLEPDRELAKRLVDRITNCTVCNALEIVVGDLSALHPDRRFNTILYVDVLEHIANDRAEVAAALARLHRGGALIIVAPAHQWLFSPFDRAIGHYRRYNADSLSALTPSGATLDFLAYLDSAGLVASVVNKLLLRESTPRLSQVLVWDRVIVPCSRLLDRAFGYRIGKSIVAVWQRSI
jgi:hypothetical protein